MGRGAQVIYTHHSPAVYLPPARPAVLSVPHSPSATWPRCPSMASGSSVHGGLPWVAEGVGGAQSPSPLPPPKVQLAGTAARVVGQACVHGDSKSYLRVNKYRPELPPPPGLQPRSGQQESSINIHPPPPPLHITAQQREHVPGLAFTYPSASHWWLPAGSWMATQHAGASFRGASRAPSLLCSPSSPPPPSISPSLIILIAKTQHTTF